MRRTRHILPEYLRAKVAPFEQTITAVPLILLFALLYELLAGKSSIDGIPKGYFSLLAYVLLFCLIALFLKLPRWIPYFAIILAIIIHVFYFTQIIAKFDQDANSTRDDAVEMTTKAFLRGENPWNNMPELGVQATTGPASILLAMPFVMIFGEINLLTFLFWVLIFAISLVGDIQNKNNSFPILSLLFITGIFGFSHTLFWSLDELYFPFWHVAIAALLAQTIAWFSSLASDYELLFVIPTFLAVAFTPRKLTDYQISTD
jgi:hypothetical protein